MDIKLTVETDGRNFEVCSEYIEPGRELFISQGTFFEFYCEVIGHKRKQKDTCEN